MGIYSICLIKKKLELVPFCRAGVFSQLSSVCVRKKKKRQRQTIRRNCTKWVKSHINQPVRYPVSPESASELITLQTLQATYDDARLLVWCVRALNHNHVLMSSMGGVGKPANLKLASHYHQAGLETVFKKLHFFTFHFSLETHRSRASRPLVRPADPQSCSGLRMWVPSLTPSHSVPPGTSAGGGRPEKKKKVFLFEKHH